MSTYIPVCPDHEQKGRNQIVTNEDEVREVEQKCSEDELTPDGVGVSKAESISGGAHSGENLSRTSATNVQASSSTPLRRIQIRYSDDQPRDYHGRWTDGGDSDEPTHFDTLEQGGSKNVSGMDPKDAVDRLVDIYNRNPDAVEDGKWYERQHDVIANLSEELTNQGFKDITAEKVAACVATTSPQCAWDTKSGTTPNFDHAIQAIIMANDHPELTTVSEAREFAASLEHPGFPSAYLGTAIAMANGASFEDYIKNEAESPKVASFYNNLVAPGETNSVTVDTWMCRAVAGMTSTDDYKGAERDIMGSHNAGYQWVADRIREAADQVGVKPDEFQAATWCQYRAEMGKFSTKM